MRFFRFLYGDIGVEIPSLFSLQDSVKYLRDSTKRSVFSALFSRAAVGRVTETSVRLQWVIPMFRNSFKPMFVGKFQEIDGQVVLIGKFTMFLFTKIFMSIWLGLALFLPIFAFFLRIFDTSGTVTPVENPLWASIFPFLIGIGFFLFGILFARFCWWLSKSDMEDLKNVMTRALQSGPNRG